MGLIGRNWKHSNVNEVTGTNPPTQHNQHKTNNTKTTKNLPASTFRYLTHHPSTTRVTPTNVSVVDSGGETPGPIPNPEAKPARADGTALGRVWESRLPPTKQQQNNNKIHQKQPNNPPTVAGLFSYTHHTPNTPPRAQEYVYATPSTGVRVRH